MALDLLNSYPKYTLLLHFYYNNKMAISICHCLVRDLELVNGSSWNSCKR